MSKNRPLLKAIFSTANFNGVGATIMSGDKGTLLGTGLYVGAVLAGTYNKYRGLTRPDEKQGVVMNLVTHPSITAAAFVLAAGYNLCSATHAYMNGTPEMATANLLVMSGWVAGLLGDNALRRLDSVNFKKSAQELGGSLKSNLSKTFNALVANPTIFYGLTSTFFVWSGMINRVDDAGVAIPFYAGVKGAMGVATTALVGAGIVYAGYRSWQAAKGKIATEQINDGAMNWMAFVAKLGYGVLAFTNKEIWLGIAHLLFAGSSLKVISETQSALKKKDEAPAPVPAQ